MPRASVVTCRDGVCHIVACSRARLTMGSKWGSGNLGGWFGWMVTCGGLGVGLLMVYPSVEQVSKENCVSEDQGVRRKLQRNETNYRIHRHAKNQRWKDSVQDE